MAIPDLLHPDRHLVGEEVSISGATIAYLGLARSGDEIIARFRLVEGSLGVSARVLAPDGATVEVSASGNELVSQPFGSALEPPARDATITLIIGDRLIPFVVGQIR